MIGRIVHQQHRVLLPAWGVQIQLRDQLPEEQHIGILIRLGMAQREPDSTIRIQSGDHREGWTNGFQLHAAGAAGTAAPQLPRYSIRLLTTRLWRGGPVFPPPVAPRTPTCATAMAHRHE